MSSIGTLHRRVFVGTVSNLLGQGVIVICALALTPIIVHRVGATDYGIWVLIGSIASFVYLLDIGISAGLVKYVAEHVARSEYDEGARVVGAATWIYVLIGVGVCVVGLGLAAMLPALFDLHGHTRRVVPAVVALVALDCGISIPSIAPLAVLRGLQRFSLANGILAGGVTLGAGLTVGALLLGGGIVGVAAAAAVSDLIAFAISIGVVRRVAPKLTGRLVRPDRQRARRLLRFSSSVALIQVAGKLQTRTDAVVIGAALPVRLVTPYSFGQRLATGTEIATEQFGKVLLPLATEIGATRGRADLRPLVLTATRLMLAIALGVGLPLAFLGGPILKLWVGNAFAGYGTVVALLAVAQIVALPSSPAVYVLQSLERHGPVAWMALGGAVANVGLSVALVGRYGINGVAAATLVATAAYLVVFSPYATRVLGLSLRELAAEVLLRLAVPAVVLAGLLSGGAAILPVTSLVRLAVVVGVALGGYVLTYVVLGAGTSERAAYRSGAAAAMRLASRPLALRSHRSARS